MAARLTSDRNKLAIHISHELPITVSAVSAAPAAHTSIRLQACLKQQLNLSALQPGDLQGSEAGCFWPVPAVPNIQPDTRDFLHCPSSDLLSTPDWARTSFPALPPMPEAFHWAP